MNDHEEKLIKHIPIEYAVILNIKDFIYSVHTVKPCDYESRYNAKSRYYNVGYSMTCNGALNLKVQRFSDLPEALGQAISSGKPGNSLNPKNFIVKF